MESLGMGACVRVFFLFFTWNGMAQSRGMSVAPSHALKAAPMARKRTRRDSVGGLCCHVYLNGQLGLGWMVLEVLFFCAPLVERGKAELVEGVGGSGQRR
jgi:hypothetical protein